MSSSNAPPASDFPKPVLPAQEDSANPCKTHQYAVKIVCGLSGAKQSTFMAPGHYFTAINIHNPATCRTVTFRWRAVVANPINTPSGIITAQQKITLRPEESVEIDTPDVLRVTGAIFAKGFVVIESPCELDIVAVYSISGPPIGTGIGSIVAFHTERVPARCVDACQDDLTLDLSTGTADWTLTSAVDPNGGLLPISTPRPAATIGAAANGGPWGTQPGTLWISVNPFANIPNLTIPGLVPGFYTFQTCFQLCSGFEGALLDLHMFNDDEANVWLNNTHVGGFPGNSNGTPAHIPVTAGFLPGVNCVSVVVKNDQNQFANNPVGLNVHGLLTARRGRCADSGCGCGCCG